MSYSKVLGHRVLSQKNINYTFKDVCLEIGVKDSLLLEAVDNHRLDCMGQIVKVGPFCQRKMAKNKFFTRGYINRKMGEVICEAGAQVRLKIECDERDGKYCHSPKSGCDRLKSLFASRHDLNHFSVDSFDKKKVLNCHFSAQDEGKIPTALKL